MIFHAASALVIFFLWRLTGMPSPGLLGRLIPLSWMITAIVYGKGRIPEYSIFLLSSFVVLSLFWTVSPALEILSTAVGFAGIFPGLFRISSRRFGILLAMLPVIPMILLLVPFTGDEPHYAFRTEHLISSSADRFIDYSNQIGDPVGNFAHHQSFYPALMIPGYPLSVPGIRGMNFVFALVALLLLSVILKESGYEYWKQSAVLGFLLLPGSGILGLVYPGWLALAVFLSGVYASLKTGKTAWIITAALMLLVIKFRFAGISAGLLAALVIESKGRNKYLLPLIIIALTGAGLLFDLLVLNGRIFWVRYGNISFLKTLIVQPLYRMPEIITAAGSSLVDIESGLLWKAPWFLAGLAGLPLLKNRNRKLFLWLGLPALIYYLMLIFWTGSDWSGVPTPSGRMLLPVIPVMLASIGYMLKQKVVRVLIWASLGISAIYFAYPILRFNYGDGTDALVSRMFGPLSSINEWVPSGIRIDIAVFAGWILISAAIIWLIARKSRFTEYTVTSVFLLLCIFGGLKKKSWEAEDIPPGYRNYCAMYPDETNPDYRKFWFFTRQRMLRMSSPEDAIILPINKTEEDSLRLVIFHRSFRSGPLPGLEVSCGDWHDSLYSYSELMEAPVWTAIMKDTRIPFLPENLEELRSEFVIPSGISGDSIVIRPLGIQENNGLQGIYLDRILFPDE